MNKDAVQHERGPRNSTIRRHVAMYLKETSEMNSLYSCTPFQSPYMPGYYTFERLNDGITISAIDPPSLPMTSIGTPVSPTPTTNFPRTICQPTPKYPHELIQSYFHNPEAVCEAAARLLFISIKWTKNVPALLTLPYRDQVLLLEESWSELFVLGAAQFQMPLEITTPLPSAVFSSETAPIEKVVDIVDEIRILQEIIAKFRSIQVDATEFACLKGIVLFKTVLRNNSSKDIKSLRAFHTVASLQDQTQMTLNKYIQTAYPTQPFRFGKLLLLLPTLKTVRGATIEELFFRKTIGSIPIERLLVDMFKSNDF